MNTPEKNPVQTRNFLDKTEEKPCDGCPAPCCRMLLIPHPTPTTFMDLDYIRYMVGFQNVEMILSRNGQWQVLVKQDCQLFDQENNRCTVHNTSRKPKTCVFFNPYHCWYRRTFNKSNPTDIIRIDMEVMEAILSYVKVDAEDNIIETPQWEFIWDLINVTDEKRYMHSHAGA